MHTHTHTGLMAILPHEPGLSSCHPSLSISIYYGSVHPLRSDQNISILFNTIQPCPYQTREMDVGEGRGVEGKYVIPWAVTGADFFVTGCSSCCRPVLKTSTGPQKLPFPPIFSSLTDSWGKVRCSFTSAVRYQYPCFLAEPTNW